MERNWIFQHADGQQGQNSVYKEWRRVKNILSNLLFWNKKVLLNNSPTPARHISSKLCCLHHMRMKKPNLRQKARNYCRFRANVLYNYTLAFLGKFVEEEEDESTGITKANGISRISIF